jgi:hypothetical protein
MKVTMTRITAKQKSARRMNVAVARKARSKKSGLSKKEGKIFNKLESMAKKGTRMLPGEISMHRSLMRKKYGK